MFFLSSGKNPTGSFIPGGLKYPDHSKALLTFPKAILKNLLSNYTNCFSQKKKQMVF
jgi:hypothetical protein